jgi:hypothetical protein
VKAGVELSSVGTVSKCGGVVIFFSGWIVLSRDLAMLSIEALLLTAYKYRYTFMDGALTNHMIL